MNSDGEETTETPVQPPSKTSLAVDVLKATYIPLLVGVLCVIGLVALWFYGVPWRPIAVVTIIVCVAGPFVVCYAFLFNWVLTRKGSIPVAIVDVEGRQHQLLYFQRSAFAECVVEGGKLGTRQTAVGTMYIAEDYRIDQRERVNEETGEKENYAQPVLEASWEGEVDPMEVVERWKAYDEQKQRLVPLAQEAVTVRAGSDSRLAENTVRMSHGVVLGAERDTFFDNTADPLNWELGVDKKDITTVVGADDQDGDRDDRPEPGSRSIQPDRENDVGQEAPADD